MLGNFIYSNPTKIYFGEDSLQYLGEELSKYGKNVQLIYGGGSIKKNGLYEQVMELLKASGKAVVEDGGVMPNPMVEKLAEGVRIARENQVDLLLAVGGGSCCDYAKAVSVSVHCEEEPWEKYYIRFEEPSCEIVPVGCVLTMVGTGSEMNGGAVITNHEQKLKIGHVFGDNVMPKFSILNPKYTYTLLNVRWWLVFMIFSIIRQPMRTMHQIFLIYQLFLLTQKIPILSKKRLRMLKL